MSVMAQSFHPGKNNQTNDFLESIETHFKRVLKYENEDLRKKAKSCIPLGMLQLKAINRMRSLQARIKGGLSDEPEMQLEDCVLIELLSWFKDTFFKWVDSPPCRICDGITKYSHNTTTISSFETIRVEVFTCTKCKSQTEFPRYNDPGVLLKTRKGRCGEWANCFALICRALNYDTRFVVDTTDHVWIEVYSYTNKKWLHCDPCENIIDSPLLYEAGWGKKLEYVIAYSKDEIQDVTWRYTSDHKAALKRRNKCSESDLVSLILRLRNQRWEGLSEARKKFVMNRMCAELVDLMIERKATSDEKVGRMSGSLTWRLQRKETNAWSPYVWKFAEHREITIRYSTARDIYEVVQSDGTVIDSKNEWMNGAYSIENVCRKEENDWKMTYLAREENTNTAQISWKIITYLRMVIESVVIKVTSTAFESGSIVWRACYGDQSIVIPKEKESNYELLDLVSVAEFSISAQLSGGKGTTAWQHSQIFRQSLDSEDYPFQIVIRLKVENKE